MNSKYLLLLVAMVRLAPLAHADAGYPYMGDRPAPCFVVQSDSSVKDFDAGYLSDEDCKTIYVLPPMLGQLKIGAPGYLDTRMCSYVDQALGTIDRARAVAGDDLERQAEVATKVKELYGKISRIGGGQPFSVFDFTASLDWNTLIAAYRKANPNMNINIKPLPVVVGLLNGTNSDQDDQDDPIAKIKIFGPGFRTPTLITNPDTEDLIAKLTSDIDVHTSSLFAGAVGGQISLRLTPTCGMFDSEGKMKDDPRGLFAGTYTYFYPVQTSSSYQIQLQNTPQFEEKIMQVLQQNNGVITSKQINEVVATTPVVSIKIKNGVGNDGSDQLAQDYKVQMQQYIANAVVASVADRVAAVVNDAKYSTSESRITRQCSGDWPFHHCWDHEYYVSIQHIDWTKVKNNLSNLLNNDAKSGDGGSIKKYKMIYLYGTSAFGNVK